MQAAVRFQLDTDEDDSYAPPPQPAEFVVPHEDVSRAVEGALRELTVLGGQLRRLPESCLFEDIAVSLIWTDENGREGIRTL